ncbi:MAG: helix-turn-helix domain-containing protein [Xenococcaceae cyanobacterium MO_188.B19]|nr:helix-turn-helix domain-containing protein [Xenococcaceae cyanobacterium MO_188.B19]
MNRLIQIFFDLLMEHGSQERLAKFIRQLRGNQSQRAFAKTLGVSYAAVRAWEEGEAMPAIKSLQLIATYSRQSVEYLLDYLRYGETKNSITGKSKVAEDLLAELNYLPEHETTRLIEILVEKYLSKEESARLAKMLINKLASLEENSSVEAKKILSTNKKNNK